LARNGQQILTLCSWQASLEKLLLFTRLEANVKQKIVAEMYERTVAAGEILIKEGDVGIAAAELYVVKSGKFEVMRMPL
jgi:CRP-like cAMP-binding protein